MRRTDLIPDALWVEHGEDGEDTMHVDPGALCRRFGWDVTPANVEKAEALAREQIAQRYPDAPWFEVWEP